MNQLVSAATLRDFLADLARDVAAVQAPNTRVRIVRYAPRPTPPGYGRWYQLIQVSEELRTDAAACAAFLEGKLLADARRDVGAITEVDFAWNPVELESDDEETEPEVELQAMFRFVELRQREGSR